MDEPNSSSVDDVWASLKDGETERLSEYRKRATLLKSKSNISVVDLIRKTERKAERKEKAEKEKAGLGLASAETTATVSSKDMEKKRNLEKSILPIHETISELMLGEHRQQEIEKDKHVSFGSNKISDGSPIEIKNSTSLSTGTENLLRPGLGLQHMETPKSSSATALLMRSNEMQSKIARDLNLAGSDDVNIRRKVRVRTSIRFKASIMVRVRNF
jgi:hypothetical protein